MTELTTELLRPAEAAVLLTVHADTLARWRREGKGPRFVKFGTGRTAIIRYRREDLETYIDESSQSSTAETRLKKEAGGKLRRVK